MIETAQKLQEEYKEDSGLKGMIEEFLKIPITDDWYDWSLHHKQQYFEKELYKNSNLNLTLRKKICALEVWKECLQNTRDITKKDSGEINQILRGISYLYENRTKFGHYGQ